jgi:hypothetical protein
MSIIRVSHNRDNPYVMINKKGLEDVNMSWAAKGLWSYLMSRPDDWEISIAHLSSIYKFKGGGEKAIYSLLNELIEEGYCIRTQPKNSKGVFEKTSYTLLEFKNKLPHSPQRDAVERDAVESSLTNKEVLLIKELLTTHEPEPPLPELPDIVPSQEVVVFLDADKKEKINSLQKLKLKDETIAKCLRYSLEEINVAIECCLNADGKIENIDGYLWSALSKKWQPKQSKSKLEALAKKEVEEKEILKKKLKLQVEKLYEKFKPLFKKNKNFSPSAEYFYINGECYKYDQISLKLLNDYCKKNFDEIELKNVKKYSEIAKKIIEPLKIHFSQHKVMLFDNGFSICKGFQLLGNYEYNQQDIEILKKWCKETFTQEPLCKETQKAQMRIA